MNIAIIFAGGSGIRMNNSSRPKQFLELYKKPIIIYTIEHFERHADIDEIVVVCLEPWIDYLKEQLEAFKITKVRAIVPGGSTGQDSIWKGIETAHKLYPGDSTLLIHDGVRPLIDKSTISANIETAHKKGNCITCVKAIETFIVKDNEGHITIPDRDKSLLARAPQTFILSDIYEAHCKAREENRHDFIDSCTLMEHYGHTLNMIIGPIENIKVTTPTDYFMFKAIIKARENEEIFGL